MHRWVDHTSELELRLESVSAEEALAEATSALGELLGEAEGTPVLRELDVESGDAAGALAALLDELVFLAEAEGLVAPRARRVGLAGGRLSAEIEARPGRAAHLVKAVTLHRLALERRGDRWHGTVVLDV